MTRSPERLRRAEDVLFRILALPEAERAAAVDAACDGDPELASEVRSLLAHAGNLGEFLETPPLGAQVARLGVEVEEEAAAERDERIGRVVGRYRIRSRIASGGMGTVYLALRDDGEFQQRVAVKVVKRGMDTEEILRRFRAERHTLAALEHPNIARLLDAGALESGEPYLVMEYVEGEPVDVYCDRRRLAVVDRLQLFLVVCEAVRFAHQNLVIHRDLKPSNILVGTGGTPKLLDFGISKVIASGEAPLATAREERRLTPEYASPEQVAGRPVTTASDVYSLGVILYELLSGHSPYRFPTRSLADIERVVVEESAPAPSEAVGRAATRREGERDAITPESVGRARGTTPEHLRRRLRGDLDTIVLAALRKEPQRRYASVEQLAGDVKRHLDGMPVSARKDTASYRLGKFVRRHTAGTALAALSALLLAAGTAAVAWQARVAARQRDEAFVARDQAEATTAFLQETLASADPGDRGRAATVLDVLGAAAQRIEGELDDQPLVKASLRSTIGRTFLSLGRYDDAERQLRRAHDERSALLGRRHHDVAESMLDLAELLYARRSLDEAAALLRGALEIFQEIRGESNPDAARTLSSLGAVLRMQGRVAEAEDAQRRALAIRRAVSGARSLDAAESLNNLASVLLAQGRLDEAESALAEALDIRRSRLGHGHPLVAQSLNNLAVLLHRKGELARAEPLYREALSLDVERKGDDHPSVASTRENLAVLLRARGDLAGALELVRACLSARRKAFAPSDTRVILTELQQAEVLAALDDWTGALPLIEEALTAARDPAATPGTRARALGWAADLLAAHGEPGRAAALRAESRPP